MRLFCLTARTANVDACLFLKVGEHGGFGPVPRRNR
jgi:hypothetical protein